MSTPLFSAGQVGSARKGSGFFACSTPGGVGGQDALRLGLKLLGRKIERALLSAPTTLSRLCPFPVSDLLKPAYSFGGLPLVQLGKPYVDNWLNVRQSTADIAQAYSIFVLATDLSATLAGGAGEDIEKRVKLFNKNRSNKGTIVIDKDHEDFKNISANIAGIEAIQAASQEHMSAAWRIPLVKLTGISPSGLNASSEGEIRVYYDLEKEGAKGANDACRRAQRSPCLRQQPWRSRCMHRAC